MARRILLIVLVSIASSGCAGQPWLARGGGGDQSIAVATPAQRMGRDDATPGFLPSDYAGPRLASHGGEPQVQPIRPPQFAQPAMAQQPLAGSESPRQQNPPPANAPHSHPALSAMPGSSAAPYTSVYDNPYDGLARELVKQAFVEAIRETTTAPEARDVAAPSPADRPSDALDPGTMRASAFNINDRDDIPDAGLPPATTAVLAATQAAASSLTEGEQPGDELASATTVTVDQQVVQATHTTTSDVQDVAKDAAPSAAGKWRDEATTALAALERDLAANKYSTTERARLNANARLLHAILNDTEKALAPIEGASDDEREYWKHLTHGLMYSLDADGKNTFTRRSALALRSLRTASDHLANISTLDVRNLAFCSKVESYGRFDEFKSYGFKPGQEVLLYVEVENFAVESSTDRHETELQGEYTIFDADGQFVANAVLPLDKQVSKNRRRDYFIAYRLFLPKKIDQGHYTLQLTVEDVKGSKSNQGSVEFWIR